MTPMVGRHLVDSQKIAVRYIGRESALIDISVEIFVGLYGF